MGFPLIAPRIVFWQRIILSSVVNQAHPYVQFALRSGQVMGLSFSSVRLPCSEIFTALYFAGIIKILSLKNKVYINSHYHTTYRNKLGKNLLTCCEKNDEAS